MLVARGFEAIFAVARHFPLQTADFMLYLIMADFFIFLSTLSFSADDVRVGLDADFVHYTRKNTFCALRVTDAYFVRRELF